MLALGEAVTARELPAAGGVRIWGVDLAPPPLALSGLMELLSGAERARADRLGTEPARRRFVVARASLRNLLAAATGVPAEFLELGAGRDGKPFLSREAGRPAVEFNLSHSRDLALVAIGTRQPIGVDLEWTLGSTPFLGIARRFFSAAEQAELETTPPGSQRERFYRTWVRKESYLKGRGEGISEWIHRTDFSATGSGSGTGRDQDGWQVHDLEGLPPGFVASLAVARGD